MRISVKLTCAILSVFLLGSCVLGCTPDAGGNENPIVPGQLAGFKLPHYSGIAESEDQYNYNSDLFYRNETQNEGADPACVYVSEADVKDTYEKHKKTYMYKTESGEWAWLNGESEQKFIAENGTLDEWMDLYCNNYYMATTSSTTSLTTETRAKYGSDVAGAAYVIRTSNDLVNWKLCGRADGYSLIFRNDSFATADFWAPEIIRDAETGYFFMFFSCLTKSGNANTVYPAATSLEQDRHVGGVAYSANPIGPYEFITAEKYMSLKAAKNSDGSVKTGDTLITNQINGYKYYEVFDNDGNVIGYKNTAGFYNLNGYEVNEETPIILPSYYYPRYATDGERKTNSLAQIEKLVNKEIKADGITSYNLGLIDLFPARDDQGNLYTFFTVEGSYDWNAPQNQLYGTWVVEMKDIITPNWDTLRMVLKPGTNKIVDNGTFLGEHQGTVDFINENRVGEGTEIVFHEGRWYLTYSYDYFVSVGYSVGIAVADNPLGPYDKFNGRYSPLVGRGDEYNNYKAGTGHHVFVHAGDELFVMYHATHNPDDNYDNEGNYLGRNINIDRGVWKYDEDLGYDMLFCNGATVNLQPKPESYTGYTNVAKFATVTGNGDFGSVESVNDGMFTAQPFSRKYEYGKADGGLEITLKWDTPVNVKAVMIYNSGNYHTAFNKVSTIRFKLAEKPAWYMGTEYNGYCYVKDLPVDGRDEIKQYMVIRHGNSAIAEFDEIKITEMYVYISGNAEDKFTEEDEAGLYWEGYKEVHVSDIYVFGNKA